MGWSVRAGSIEVPLLEQTIGANFEATAKAHAEREALVVVHQGVRWTYAELDAEVDRVARGLLALGLASGDRIGMWSPNHAEWVLVQYATAKIGAILVNINPAYRSHELTYVLNQSGCRFLVAATEHKSSDYRAILEESRPDAPLLERTIFIGTDDWDDLLAAGVDQPEGVVPERLATLDPRDPINIQYTSGTTGFPKGATLSHRNILNNGYFVAELCRHTPEDRVCIPVPFYHCFGMVMGNLGCTTHGSTMVVPGPSFDPDDVLEAVAAERCTSLFGVPTMFIAELASPKVDQLDLSSLRTGIMAGSPCPVEVMKQVIARMGMDEVTVCYGMTETSPVSTQTRADDSLDRRVSTVGRVHPHVEVKVVDPATGDTVAEGEPGELCTRGYSVMSGYWNDPERTSEAIDAKGWMHTGDLATMDAEGYVNIVGRSKDLIIRGGENVYPREVEEFLYTHPAVADVQVIGVPDERYGEAVMAWVQLRDGAAATAEDLRAFCDGKIAHFKVPRYVQLTDTFPMTVTGKVQKFKMREDAIALLGLEQLAATRTA
ncbi:MAG: AMP-binding protein [Acidimicrobiales bacterium]|nr:AMP-binding protein [Acidimicrobiales bacterium]